MSTPLSETALDLLIERELYGMEALSPSDQQEAVRASEAEETPSIASIVALIDSEFTERRDLPPLNTALRNRILLSAHRVSVPVVAKQRNYREIFAWTAAAALLFAFLSQRNAITDRERVQDPAAGLLALTSEADCVRRPWEAVEPAFAAVRGEVVWSHDRNEGYMVFEGLPINDRKVSQYQLWIIDPSRDSKPVDGGVFDMPNTSSRVVIPVRQKLEVDRPKAFIITEEQPGGVVVSDGPFLLKAAMSD